MVGWLVVDGREEGWLDEWMDENGLLDGCESSVLGRLVRGEGLAPTCTLHVRQSTTPSPPQIQALLCLH